MQNALQSTMRAIDRADHLHRTICIVAVGGTFALRFDAAWAQSTESVPVVFDPIPNFLLWIIVFSVYVLVFFSLAFVMGRLAKTPDGLNWRLSEALSEEATEETGGVKTVRLVGSTSRLIALFGLIVILVLFLSFGVIAIWSFGRTGKIPPDLAELAKYLLGGAALFIPYGINQIRAAFDNVAK